MKHPAMKYSVQLVAVLILLCATPSLSSGQKIGYINYGRLLEGMPTFPDVMKAQEAYQDSLTSAFEAKLTAHQQRVQQLTASYNRGEMTDQEADKINAQLNAAEQELAEDQRKLEGLVLARRRSDMSPMIAQALEGIEAFAKDNGYQLILDEASGFLLFNKPEEDLTTAIAEFIKAR